MVSVKLPVSQVENLLKLYGHGYPGLLNNFLAVVSGYEVEGISELIDCQLDLTLANGISIPYKGFVELTFKLKTKQDAILVPSW